MLVGWIVHHTVHWLPLTLDIKVLSVPTVVGAEDPAYQLILQNASVVNIVGVAGGTR